MIRASRQRPLSCRAVGRLLQGYLDAEVPGTVARRVAAHLDDCRRCGLDADAYRGLITAVVGEMQLQSLMGHVLYGLTLGLVVQAFVRVSQDERVPSRA